MFISAEDSYNIWLDGEKIQDLKYYDVWSYPDRLEVRSDSRLIAVQINTIHEPSVAHGMIVFSPSGKFDTKNHSNWRCRDYLEEADVNNWYLPGFIQPDAWPASILIAPNSNFRSKLNPWPGAVRLMPIDAMWVSSATIMSSHSHCLFFLRSFLFFHFAHFRNSNSFQHFYIFI